MKFPIPSPSCLRTSAMKKIVRSLWLFFTAASATHAAELEAPDGNTLDFFGSSGCLSGSIAIVGAHENDEKGKGSGAAYLFLNEGNGKLSATKLTASDGTIGHAFGSSVSLSGNTVLIGARHGNGNASYCGSAYVFTNLNSGSPSQYKLAAPSGEKLDFFGASVSLSGSTALVGAYGVDTVGSSSGSAYVFVNAASDSPKQYKLAASDGTKDDSFGLSVSLSDSTALIGATGNDDKGSHSGSAYLFLKADTNKPREIKLTSPDGAPNDLYGSSVSLDGDNFLIGAKGKNGGRGKAYTGKVSSLTALNEGGARRVIEGLCFISKDDWTVGVNTRGNRILLAKGSSADVSAAGKCVCIGREAGADGNELTLAGTLKAEAVHIGGQGRNGGNVLLLEDTATLEADALHLATGNLLAFQGDCTDEAALFGRLGGTVLKVWNHGGWVKVGGGNFRHLLSSRYRNGYTYVTPAAAEPGAGHLTLITRRP